MTLTLSDLSVIGIPENDICCKSLSLYMRHVFSINIETGTTGFSLYMIAKFGWQSEKKADDDQKHK